MSLLCSPGRTQPFGICQAANTQPGSGPGTAWLSGPAGFPFLLRARFPQWLQPFAKQSQLPGHKRLKFMGI